MKMFKKSVALLLVLLLITAAIPTVFAAKAGETTGVTFSMGTNYGVQGTFRIDGPGELLTKSAYIFAKDGNPIALNVSCSVKISDSAKKGDVITVYFDYTYAVDDIGTLGESGTKSAQIVVGGGTAPVKPGKGIDYSELERQIAIANGLTQSEYTKESWAVLSKALAEANAALSSKSQDEVDAAAKALADAIAALVKMDYSALEEALKAVQDFIDGDDLADLWVRLVQAFLKGKELLTSGDQEACNATASEIMSILEELKARLEELRTPEVVTQTVEVEVMPKDDFCNIPLHKLWPILFFISLILNVVLVVVIVVIVSKKKNNAKDKTPLVDYDIGDDA